VALWAVGVQNPPSDTDLRAEDAKMPRETSRAPGAIVCLLSAHSFVLLSPDPIGPPHKDADYRVVAVRQCYCNPASTSAERETPSSAAWTMRKMKTAAAAANAIRKRGK
jgi:hypothetical protein